MWIEKDNSLERTFEFKNFIEAFAFITKVALLCEKMNHYPVWENSRHLVTIKLISHDNEHAVSDKNYELSSQIDEIYYHL
ncbi:MAG: 4a-hydroxytetrahydrobiopterin dehydratase [Bacteroidales bacterium]|jgi:4a-hydroxytetrahydrobiopterin dehydratase|nr:4a-hydroxytetrahydrobiopterin dehydratase [Bacteroidales bacterium]MDD4214787.1 4a-hydroxytetrahydrobiopterin dehydratase [Bacteroidales bacterium]